MPRSVTKRLASRLTAPRRVTRYPLIAPSLSLALDEDDDDDEVAEEEEQVKENQAEFHSLFLLHNFKQETDLVRPYPPPNPPL